MKKGLAENTDNRILHRLFRRSEISYTISDVSKAIGPMIDLMFVGRFIGTNGVTVMGYVAPLIMLFELIGTTISSGARNKVSSLIGFPFFTMTRILTPYLQMEGQYKRVSTVSVLTTVIDVAADAFVIFVLGSEMFGIGLATSLGYMIPFFVSATFFVAKKNHSVFCFTLKSFSLKRCGEIFRLGAPSGIVKGSNFLGGVLINNLLTSMNTPYLVAIYGVFSQITVFFRSAWYAPADTLHAFAGVFIGEEDRDSLKETQKISLCHALIYTGIVVVFLHAVADLLALAFLKTNDTTGLELTAECIRISCLSLPFHAIVYNFNNYLMAAKKIRFCSIYSFLIECGTLVPITFLLLRIIGYQGAWVSRLISMLVLSLIAVFYISLHKGSKFTDKMLLLPDNFGISKEDEISMIASSTKDIEDLSRIAVAFAMEHGADKKRALTYGLITEELSAMLSEHGFSDGRPHNINARLVAKNEDLIIRIRDDREPFNVTEYYALIKDDPDKEKEISLSIIIKMAKDVTYTAVFGTNSLIVRI